MRRFNVGLVTSISLSLVCAATSVGAPLPDPPFPGGGYIPPTREVLKPEDDVLKILAKYAHKRSICDHALIDDLTLGYTSGNATKIEAVQTKWLECVTKVGDRYELERDRRVEKGAPACLDAAAIDALRAALDAKIAQWRAVTYCSNAGASPDPVTGLNVPDKVKDASGESEAAKRVVKSYYDAARCTRGVMAKITREQAVTADHVLRIERCNEKIAALAVRTAADLDQTQKLPDCLTPELLVAAALDARDFFLSSTGGLYCQE
jgi:hypothetical protein